MNDKYYIEVACYIYNCGYRAGQLAVVESIAQAAPLSVLQHEDAVRKLIADLGVEKPE